MRTLLVPTALLLSILPVHADDPPRRDADGDPLPPGALARLGTARFRHGGMPTGVAFIDNTTLVSDGGDGVLRFWEVPSGRQLRETPGTTLGYAPLTTDGQVVVGVGRDHYFAAWDARTGKFLRSFGHTGETYPARSAGIHGDLLAFTTPNGVALWNIDGREPLRTLIGVKEPTTAVALSSDGRLVAAGTGDVIRLWDTATGKHLRDLAGHGEYRVWALAFAPGKAKLLASTGGDNTARLWDVESGKELHVFRQKWATALAFSPDGKFLAVGDKWDEAGIALYDVATFKLIRRFPGAPRYHAVHGLAFSPDGKYLACSGIDSVVQLFEVATGRALHRPDQPQASIRDLFLSPDGRSAVTGGEGLEANVWDLTTGKRTAVPTEKVGVPAGFGKDGRVLIGRIGSFEATFYWFDPATGQDERVVRVPYSIHTLGLKPDDSTLVILTTNNGNLALWDLARGKEVAAPQRASETDGYYGLALSPDGKRLTTSGVVREVPSGKLVRVLKPSHGRTVNGVAFSPDGKTVATVSALQVLLFDAEGERPGRALPLEGDSGWSIALHPDGRWLAVGERSGVALHDVTTGRVVHRWTGHRGLVRQLAFTPDGRRLVSGGNDASLLVWDVAAVRK